MTTVFVKFIAACPLNRLLIGVQCQRWCIKAGESLPFYFVKTLHLNMGWFGNVFFNTKQVVGPGFKVSLLLSFHPVLLHYESLIDCIRNSSPLGLWKQIGNLTSVIACICCWCEFPNHESNSLTESLSEIWSLTLGKIHRAVTLAIPPGIQWMDIFCVHLSHLQKVRIIQKAYENTLAIRKQVDTLRPSEILLL